VLKTLLGLFKRSDSAPLSIRPPSTEGQADTLESQRESLAARKFCPLEVFVELPINGATHVGYPSFPLQISSGVRWGPKVEWSWPDPAKPRVLWIDDEYMGLAKRSLRSPEDALGAKGKIGQMRVIFESILDAGKHQIVYALYCPEKDMRLAYSFARSVFEQD